MGPGSGAVTRRALTTVPSSSLALPPRSSLARRAGASRSAGGRAGSIGPERRRSPRRRGDQVLEALELAPRYPEAQDLLLRLMTAPEGR